MSENKRENAPSDDRASVPEPTSSPVASSAQHMELYKLAVEMADRVSTRRGSTNAFFVTVNTAILGFVSTAKLDPIWPVAASGIVISLTWALLIKSYRDLNAAKFGVITSMEDSLPVKVYGDEWEKLKKDSKPLRESYAEFSAVEFIVPLIFAVLYVALFVFLPVK